jgi:hypothetical protein
LEADGAAAELGVWREAARGTEPVSLGLEDVGLKKEKRLL